MQTEIVKSDLRRAIVAEARSWLGTPYRHQGREKGRGCDCLGLIVEVGRALGLLGYEKLAYSPHPDGVTLRRECDRHLTPLDVAGEDAPPGSVLLLWVQNRRTPQHLAIVTDLPGRLGIVHAHQMLGAVREHGFDGFWLKRVIGVYDFSP